MSLRYTRESKSSGRRLECLGTRCFCWHFLSAWYTSLFTKTLSHQPLPKCILPSNLQLMANLSVSLGNGVYACYQIDFEGRRRGDHIDKQFE